MNLSYYLDLKSLCNANTKQMEFFFQLAFDILAESQNFSDSLFEESFIRDDDDDVLLLNHKSGQSLYEIFFYTFSGEIGNRIIPIVLHGFGSQNSQINDNIPYGEIEGKVHPNAKLVTPQRTKYLWLLSELIITTNLENTIPIIRSYQMTVIRFWQYIYRMFLLQKAR